MKEKHWENIFFRKCKNAINDDFKNTVFSYIPNTAETAFFGLVEAVQDHLKNQALNALKLKANPTKGDLEKTLKL